MKFISSYHIIISYHPPSLQVFTTWGPHGPHEGPHGCGQIVASCGCHTVIFWDGRDVLSHRSGRPRRSQPWQVSIKDDPSTIFWGKIGISSIAPRCLQTNVGCPHLVKCQDNGAWEGWGLQGPSRGPNSGPPSCAQWWTPGGPSGGQGGHGAFQSFECEAHPLGTPEVNHLGARGGLSCSWTQLLDCRDRDVIRDVLSECLLPCDFWGQMGVLAKPS